MIRFSVLTILVMLTQAGALNAQTSSAPSLLEPQYINSFYALDGSGKLTELQHQTVTTFHSKMRR